MDLGWARDLRNRSNGVRTPFFFKQVDGPRRWEAGRLLDGRVWAEYPRKAVATTPKP